MSRPLVYIAHPLTPYANFSREDNRANAAKWVAWAAKVAGVAPVADWITLSGEWTEEERDLGLTIDFAQIERCESIFLVGGFISGGMKLETIHAHKFNVQVFDLTSLGRHPPSREFVIDISQFRVRP